MKKPMKEKYELAQEVGERIKIHRKEMKMSQAELARRCEKDPQAIELVENGKTNPTLYTLYIISTSMDLHLKELF
jgi:transcriptional regulator with XRE-family HTH domain